MKYCFLLFLGLFVFSGCGGSGKVTVDEFLHDKNFNSNDFLNSKISIYSPYILTYSKQKYPDISEKELTREVLNRVKEKLEAVSDNSKIKIENRKAPDYFRGIKLNPQSGEELLKKTDADYLLIIQSVTIGNTITKKAEQIDNFPSTPPPPPPFYDPGKDKGHAMDQEKYTTKKTTGTTIYYNIWDVKKGISVMTVSGSVLLSDGINHKNPYLSIDKVAGVLADYIKGAK